MPRLALLRCEQAAPATAAPLLAESIALLRPELRANHPGTWEVLAESLAAVVSALVAVLGLLGFMSVLLRF